ncbi:hypothetical protein ACWN8V_13215 [Vagococcus elongatus]|uniref:Uncharacterized protein n=1 Tax=Vagococcus elongatus TaxID=180344 RepID=A0A430ALA5_9ENTE|nr:hypothetical protein [Vagococcus elongatus]RSU08866.1 hypothetical protein CBF29_12985 [Vagococcus elongatus]
MKNNDEGPTKQSLLLFLGPLLSAVDDFNKKQLAMDIEMQDYKAIDEEHDYLLTTINRLVSLANEFKEIYE